MNSSTHSTSIHNMIILQNYVRSVSSQVCESGVWKLRSRTDWTVTMFLSDCFHFFFWSLKGKPVLYSHIILCLYLLAFIIFENISSIAVFYNIEIQLLETKILLIFLSMFNDLIMYLINGWVCKRMSEWINRNQET